MDLAVKNSNVPETVSLLWPGLIMCAIIAVAARFLSDHYQAPTMLFALLLGLSLHHLSEDHKTLPGVEFSSSVLLKCGVALLGLRLTFADITSLGLEITALVFLGVFLTIAAGVLLSYSVGRKLKFGILTGGSVGICGASAALAISSVLPKTENSERDTAFTIVAVTTLSTVSMVLYPIIADKIGFDHNITGILLGATIHDVAQVVGAGFSVSEQSGNTATVIKLFRVSLLLPILLLLTVFYHSEKKASGAANMPWFIVGFAAATTVNSLGWVPSGIHQVLSSLSSWLLVIGIVAIGIKTSLKSLKDVGGTALLVVTVETVFLLIFISLVLHIITTP
ncbi:MAG: putative sulfate exporter family transporter [Gammaproteobacteria bacterium]|nr:putative sulfate exporter family transporter [Gammaproteobacteria bacterium]